MPLLATTQLVNARIAELGQKIAAHLTAAANAVNQQAQTVMSLSDADLAEWLNEQCEEAETLFAAHAALGAAINGAEILLAPRYYCRHHARRQQYLGAVCQRGRSTGA